MYTVTISVFIWNLKLWMCQIYQTHVQIWWFKKAYLRPKFSGSCFTYKKFYFTKYRKVHHLKTLILKPWEKRWSAFHASFSKMFLIGIIVKIINAILDFKPVCQQEASPWMTCSNTCYAIWISKVVRQSK